MIDLDAQLAVVMSLHMVVHVIQEFYLPSRHLKQDLNVRPEKSSTNDLYTEEERQYLAKLWPGTRGDFSELLVQFGFVALFSGAFPLTYLIAYVDALFQIRGDGMKLCDEHYRPDYYPASDIGTWEVMILTRI